jgi:hypothetical protein
MRCARTVDCAWGSTASSDSDVVVHCAAAVCRRPCLNTVAANWAGPSSGRLTHSVIRSGPHGNGAAAAQGGFVVTVSLIAGCGVML